MDFSNLLGFLNLNVIWFVLIAVLYGMYFILEGFDMGVGILLPFLGKGQDIRKRVVLNTIGPHWDGNEVWLVTAGGATFAAFPIWYATLFSGFYLALLLILVALIIRAIAIEFRGKEDNKIWKAFCDAGIFIGSLIPAYLWGVAFGNMIHGVPIDGTMNYVGGFVDLLNPFSLVMGLISLLTFVFHGAMYLSLKIKGDLSVDARKAGIAVWFPLFLSILLLTAINFGKNLLPLFGMFLLIAISVGMVLLARKKKTVGAFLLSTGLIIVFTVLIFTSLFPNVMVSSIDPTFNLTVYNAASGPYTLTAMLVVAGLLVPFVLLYTAWAYFVFRKRLRVDAPEELKY